MYVCGDGYSFIPPSSVLCFSPLFVHMYMYIPVFKVIYMFFLDFFWLFWFFERERR